MLHIETGGDAVYFAPALISWHGRSVLSNVNNKATENGAIFSLCFHHPFLTVVFHAGREVLLPFITISSAWFDIHQGS